MMRRSRDIHGSAPPAYRSRGLRSKARCCQSFLFQREGMACRFSFYSLRLEELVSEFRWSVNGLDPCPSPCKSIRPTALLVVSRVVRTTCANKLLLPTAKVCLLKLCDLLIIDRERSTAVALFTHEVELCRRLMTAETGRLQQAIADVFVSSIWDLRTGLGDLQCKTLPPVRFGKLLTRVLHHGFKRNQLENSSNRIFLVRL